LTIPAHAGATQRQHGYNEDMPFPAQCRVRTKARLLPALLLLSLLPLAACKRAEQTNTQQLDEASMWSNNGELRTLNVSNAEIAELTKARQAGLSDPSCVELIKLARSRQQPFSGGQPIADLLATGSSEQTVLELASLNQLGLWAGQAQALRLAGLSDKVVLAVARRRSQGLPVLSGEKLAQLKNSGANDSVILDFVQKGITEQQASSYIEQRERAAGGHGWVYQGRMRRKR
jgi:hypothetical protein